MAEEAAVALKDEANALFKSGNYSGAASLYGNAIELLTPAVAPSAATLHVMLLSNRAACALNNSEPAKAAQDCLAALAIDPLHTKARLRLAKALFAGGRVTEASEALAVAVALALPAAPDADTLCLYRQLAAYGESAARFLPADPRAEIACVSTSRELEAALAARKAVVVLRPGAYSGQSVGMATVALIGVGAASLQSGRSHTFFATMASVTLAHLSFGAGPHGAPQFSAVCITDGRLDLLDCTVTDYAEVGVLIAGPSAFARLERCSFLRLTKQAVECREGGAAELADCVIDRCMQGVSCYGGARRLDLLRCRISNCAKEGVMVSGSRLNAATRAQEAALPRQGNATTLAAQHWGEKQAGHQLEVRIECCEVRSCGTYGLSLDEGADVSVYKCVLEGNRPNNTFIKGGTTVLFAANQVIAGKGEEGVRVAVNYGATVTCARNAFLCPDTAKAIVEEMAPGFRAPGVPASAHAQSQLLMGWWSKPVVSVSNEFHAGGARAKLPSVDQLASHFHELGGAPAAHAKKSVAAEPPPACPATLCARAATCSTRSM